MEINRKNYEAYFLDYWENNLAPDQVTELFVFLEQNPGLKEEFESFENISMLPDKKIRFEPKEALKKHELIPTDHIDGKNYDEYMVRVLEGDLTEDESIELKAFIELNPKTKLEYNIYRSAFLKPDLSVRFENKEKLKKTGFFVIYRKEVIYGLSLAASVVVFLGFYFGFFRTQDNERFAGTVEKISPITEIHISIENFTDSERAFPDKIEIRNISESESSANRPDEQSIRERTTRIGSLAIRQPVILETGKKGSLRIAPENRNTTIALEPEAGATGSITNKPEKSFAARFIAGLANRVIKIEKPGNKSFIDLTIEGYNLIADKEVTLEKKTDENGKVIAYSLNGENISFSRNRSPGKD